jgi:serine/threonine protein kinase
MTVDDQPSLVLVGRYRLDAPLGQRSDGWFCRAHDLVQDEAVMVKMFRATLDEEAARGFTARAKTMIGLRHDHLMTLTNGGIADGHPYLVLETVDGFDLFDAKPGRSLSAPETAALGAGLADALAHMHEKGVVHGDLTPASVVTDADGQHRLVGFGFGRDHGGDAPADVRALGLVLAQCVDPPIPGPLARVLSAMTSANAGRRPSAADCARSLKRVAQALESGRWSPPVAVPRGWVAGLAAAGVLVTGAGVAFGPMLMSQQAESAVAAAPAPTTSQLPPPDPTTTVTPEPAASHPPSTPSHSSTTRRPPVTSKRPSPTKATPPTIVSDDPTTDSPDPTTTTTEPTTTDDPPPAVNKKPIHLPPGLLKKLLWGLGWPLDW